MHLPRGYSFRNCRNVNPNMPSEASSDDLSDDMGDTAPVFPKPVNVFASFLKEQASGRKGKQRETTVSIEQASSECASASAQQVRCSRLSSTAVSFLMSSFTQSVRPSSLIGNQVCYTPREFTRLSDFV